MCLVESNPLNLLLRNVKRQREIKVTDGTKMDNHWILK